MTGEPPGAPLLLRLTPDEMLAIFVQLYVHLLNVLGPDEFAARLESALAAARDAR